MVAVASSVYFLTELQQSMMLGQSLVFIIISVSIHSVNNSDTEQKKKGLTTLKLQSQAHIEVRKCKPILCTFTSPVT